MEVPYQRQVCHPLPSGVEGDTGSEVLPGAEDIPVLLDAARAVLIDGLLGVFREQAVAVNYSAVAPPLRRRPGRQCPIPGCVKHRADGTPMVIPAPR